MESNVPLYDLEPVGCTAQHSGALAALRLLRSYNHFLVPPDVHSMVGPLLAALPPQPPCLPSFCQHLPVRNAPYNGNEPFVHESDSHLAGFLNLSYPNKLAVLTPPPCENDIRRRGEKRPIPAEMKDEKYFERRRRNNQAAKKSRDARRIREDQIAWRACLLEQENGSLRAHIAALRQETIALRSLLAARDDVSAVTPTVAPAPSSTTAD